MTRVDVELRQAVAEAIEASRPAEHGYVPYTMGHRDPICRKAKADYMRARRAEGRRRAQAATGGPYVADTDSHGTRYAYEELGCRCAPCSTARAESDARYYAQRTGGDAA